jgi:hypothetical protein
MQELQGLRWSPHWVSHLGCIKGCLDYLRIDVSDAWLYGATGHAFVVNISAKDICPSGPTAWNTEMIYKLGRNVGYVVESVTGSRRHESLEELQKKAWDHIRSAIDHGHPCVGWELAVPEFYVIHGYDDTGYYFSGPACDQGAGPFKWHKLGDTGIGVVEVSSIRPGEPASDLTTFREAIAFALEHARKPGAWTFPEYVSGPEAFDAWAGAVEQGVAIVIGQAYNAAVWAECRTLAVGFLQEARVRLPEIDGPPLARAIEGYTTVAQNLRAVSEAYPFGGEMTAAPIGVDSRTKATVEALKEAASAERAGLDALTELVESLVEA